MSSRELMWTLQTAVDWCFPPRTEETRVRTLTPEQLKLTPSYPAPNTHCLLPYHHPDVQALVCEAKFHFNRRAHWIIGQTLVTYINNQWPEAVVVPIPLHTKRERERGFNQVRAALTASRSSVVNLAPQLLTRVRDTKPQTTLLPSERHQNVAGAFVARPRHKRPRLKTSVVLVDDVHTTGETLQAAQAALRSVAPATRIFCLTFAYA